MKNLCLACRSAVLVDRGVMAPSPAAEHRACTGCGCGCEWSALVACSECGFRVEPDTLERGRCADVRACATRLATQLSRGAGTKAPSRSTKASPAVSRPAPVHGPALCQCGCGGAVRRRFLPGHDAKLKGTLLRAARGGDSSARDELVRLGWGRFL